MVSDDERRLVAERLRMSDERDAAGFDCLLAEAVRGREFCETPCEHCHERLLGELADLIDPDCEDGRYSVARTARPVDRGALLAQVEELEKCAWYFGLDFDAGEPLRDRLKEASEDFAGCASRIREALGVSDELPAEME